jgi:formylglycine-generating enzyme required for sulfatase activity
MTFDINDFIDYSQRASIGLSKRISSGPVQMGSRFHPREEPRRNAYVREFQILIIPVTVSQYENFLNSRAEAEEQWWSKEGWAWRQGKSWGWGRLDRSKPDGWSIQRRRSDHPVTGVTYYEAEAYCKWLTHIKNTAARLPTEEEWQRAARGDDNRPFPWGEEFSADMANTLEMDLKKTAQAGSISGDISPFGVHDLAGNVQEWTSTDYVPLADEPFATDTLKVSKGASFNDSAYAARASYRRGYPPGYFYPWLGFRIVVGV